MGLMNLPSSYDFCHLMRVLKHIFDFQCKISASPSSKKMSSGHRNIKFPRPQMTGFPMTDIRKYELGVQFSEYVRVRNDPHRFLIACTISSRILVPYNEPNFPIHDLGRSASRAIEMD
jgi:hypothetical protein